MAAVILKWNYMDNNSNVLDQIGFFDVLCGYQNENLDFILEESGVDMEIERLEDQIVFTVTHEVPDNIALAAYRLVSCVVHTIDRFEMFKKKHSINKNVVTFEYELKDLSPVTNNVQEGILYRVYRLKIRDEADQCMGLEPEHRFTGSYTSSYKLLQQESDYCRI